ncbi:MAG: NAD regulator [Ponticaulis sp.]|nr:NAD regulator [Ponticaulis sp.]|tara:strand:+ start:13646 stop:14620 length:975 start_codon:yes stop_codon:yes gene_type:complete
MRLRVGLSAVIVAAIDGAPHVLATRSTGPFGLDGLPFGPFDPEGHRTFEIGLRDWVSVQTGFDIGYVEQLYTFGDRGRDLPTARLDEESSKERIISIGYLALTPEATEIGAFDAVWRDWYRFFPFEDHRDGKQEAALSEMGDALKTWSENADGAAARQERWTRACLAFGLEGRRWIEERVLERYELLYEADLVPEAARDRGDEYKGPLNERQTGTPMRSDHRRILATAMARLRGKIKYRPVIFELMPDAFTLSALQDSAEGILGLRLHKQNFRRALDKSGLVEGLGQFETATGGRPAERFRFRREILSQRAASGIQTPQKRQEN